MIEEAKIMAVKKKIMKIMAFKKMVMVVKYGNGGEKMVIVAKR